MRSHRAWYEKWSKRYALSWNILTFMVLVLGALTSILTAVGNVERWVLITLPAVSSLCAAALIQFRLKESCRIRDHGRIAIEFLICKALALPVHDTEKTKRAAIRLREATHQLELDQLAQFMAERSEAGSESRAVRRVARLIDFATFSDELISFPPVQGAA